MRRRAEWLAPTTDQYVQDELKASKAEEIVMKPL